VSELGAALRAGVVALLEASGDPALARLVAGGEVALVGPGEPWSMGSRTVTAHRAVLVMRAKDFAAITASPARFEAIKRAFAEALRSPDTELADLHIELVLPGIERSFRHAYRAAPIASGPRERPGPEAILAGAAALLDALGEPSAAAQVQRAELEMAAVPGTSTPLLRVVVRLAPADLAAVQRDARLGELLRSAVHAAAARAEEAVSIELALSLGQAR
jgi:hypothetical protein